MFENDEDVILPDEETAEPQVDETQETEEVSEESATEESVSEEVDTNETEQTEDMTEAEKKSFLKVKYNKEEIELDEENAKELAQKGLNYDKAIERAKQDSRDAYIAEQNYEWNGKPITTEAEYKQALQEKELMDKYKDQNLPDDVISELIENRKFREQYKSKEQEQQEKAKQEQDFQEFLEAYPDIKAEDIPKEVWEDHAKGKTLVDAYSRHENKKLKEQLSALKKNEENTKKAPVGSVTQHGSQEIAGEDDFLKGFNSI